MTKRLLIVLALAGAAWAGMPMLCHPISIGNAKSLPWIATEGWNGVDPSYDRSRLVADTLALLTPEAPMPVRMETMRRAVLYAEADPRLAEAILLQLTQRILEAEAAGKSDPNAWFDAGYFAETMRQTAAMRGKPDPRWKGEQWVRKAIRLGGKGMEPALAKIGG